MSSQSYKLLLQLLIPRSPPGQYVAATALPELFAGPQKPRSRTSFFLLEAFFLNSQINSATQYMLQWTVVVVLTFTCPEGTTYWKILRLLLLTPLSCYISMAATTKSLHLLSFLPFHLLKPYLYPAFSGNYYSSTSTLLLPHFQFSHNPETAGCQTRTRICSVTATLSW